MTAQQSREAFLAARKRGIGGSDIAAILGLSKYKTPYSLWLDKTGRQTEDSAGEAAYWGNVLEDVVAKQFSLVTGLKIQRVNQCLVGPEPWMLANIDRAIVNPAIAKRVYLKGGRLTTDQILECKTASGWLEKLWGESTESIPDYYLTQCQWYMGVTGAEVCHAAVLIGGQKFRHYRIEADPELFQILAGEARAFWENHVLADQPPEPTSFDDCAHLWGQAEEGSILEADSELLAMIEDLKGFKADIKAAQAEADQIELGIIKRLGVAETVMDSGKRLLTYKTQTTNRLDSKALKAAHPELAEQFTKTSTSRVLRLA